MVIVHGPTDIIVRPGAIRIMPCDFVQIGILLQEIIMAVLSVM